MGSKKREERQAKNTEERLLTSFFFAPLAVRETLVHPLFACLVHFLPANLLHTRLLLLVSKRLRSGAPH